MVKLPALQVLATSPSVTGWATALAALVLSAASPVAAGPQPRRLTPDFAPGTGVATHRSSPDAQWILYSAVTAPGQSREVFVVHRSGSPLRRVGGPPVAGSEIELIGFTGDSSRALFFRWHPTQPSTIVSARTDVADDWTTLHELGPGEEPDDLPEIRGSMVVIEPPNDEGGVELHVANAVTGATSRLDQLGDVGSWRSTSDGSRIVFTDGLGLYGTLLQPFATVKRFDQTPLGQFTPAFRIAPDDEDVAFVAWQAYPGLSQLYRAPIDGSFVDAQLLSEGLPAGQYVAPTTSGFRFAPDGSRLVYVAQHAGSDAESVYSVPSDGSAAPTFLRTLAEGVLDVVVTADSGTVVLLEDGDLRRDLFALSIDGPSTPAHRLNPDTLGVLDVYGSPFGSTVVWRSDGGAWLGNPDPVRELYRVDAAAGTASILLSRLADDEPIDVVVAGDFGDRWVYIGTPGSEDTTALFSVLPTGPRTRTARRLSPEDPGSGIGFLHRIVDAGTLVAFDVWPTDPSPPRILVVPVDGSAPAESIHGFLPSWFETSSARVMSDDATVVYALQADTITPLGPTLYLRPPALIFSDGFESGDVGAWSP